MSIVDVNSPWGGTKAGYSSYGQTFLPTFDGILVGLRLYVTSSSPFTATVWEFEPSTGQLGNNLGSKAYSTSQIYSGSYGWAEVAFQTQIKQFSGKALAFTITSSQGFGPAISDSSLYGGGSCFEYSGMTSVVLTSRDLTFQTLVIPVPEPDLPLLVGSAMIMWGMICRKRQEPMIPPLRKSSRSSDASA